MVSGRIDDLSYGHLGDATYNSEAKEWIFQRDPADGRQLRQVGQENTQLEPSVQSAIVEVQPVATRTKNTKSLLHEYSELVAAGTDLLLSLAQVSEHVLVATETNEPLSSDLFAFGTAENVKRGREGTGWRAKVLAIAGGPSGEAVRLLRVQKDEYKWNDRGSARLRVPTLQTQDIGWWVGSSVPVQQICFSELEGEPGRWLAVRKLRFTTIFKPLMHGKAKPQVVPEYLSADGSGGSFSTLELYPIVEVLAQSSSEPDHADVAFNPFRSRQFAIIDTKGDLRVWQLEEDGDTEHRYELVPIELSSEGDPVIHHESSTPTDGWGRVAWARDVNTIITVSRASVLVHSIGSNKQSSEILTVGSETSVDHILDIKRVFHDYCSFLVLTSTRICLLTVQAYTKGDGEDALQGEVILSWKHHRAQEDYTMRLAVGGVGDVSLVLIHSRMTAFVTYFNLNSPQTANTGAVKVSDGFHLLLRPDLLSQSSAHDPIEEQKAAPFQLMSLAPVAYSDPSQDDQENTSIEAPRLGIQCFQLWGLTANLCLTERLCSFSREIEENRRLIIHRKARTAKPKRIVDDDDGFVVPDDYISEEEFDEPRPWLSSHLNSSNPNRANISPDNTTRDLPWLREKIGELSAADQQDSRTLTSLQAAIDRLLVVSDDLPPGIHTLAEALPPHLPLNELAEASNMIQELLATLQDGAGSLAEKVSTLKSHFLLTPTTASSLAKDSDESSELSLIPTYDHILDLVLSAISHDVPGRTRIGIEKEVRQAAMLLYLSSYGLQDIPKSAADHLFDGFVLPVRNRLTPPSSPSGNSCQELPQFSQNQNPIRTLPVSQLSSSQSLPPHLHSEPDQQPQQPKPQYSPYDGLSLLTEVPQGRNWSTVLGSTLESWTIGVHPDDMDKEYPRKQKPLKSAENLRKIQKKYSTISGSSQTEVQPRSTQLETPSSQLLPPSNIGPALPSSSQGGGESRPKKKKRVAGF